MRIIITIFTLLFTAGIAQKGKTDSTLHREPVRFSKEMRGTFHGTKMNYLASHYETILYEKDDYNKPMASIFVTEYRSVKNDPDRPVIFIFNGGPGSASLWLHMGVMGPKVVKVPSDATDGDERKMHQDKARELV